MEYIREGGSGGEAKVNIELRTLFPGIGGNLVTQEGVLCAFRQEFSPIHNSSHRIFLRHMIIKKLEDFFYRTNVYHCSHIPRPLGSVSKKGKKPIEAYIYAWAHGNDGFPWELPEDDQTKTYIELQDWNKFVSVFADAGIDLSKDIADVDDGRISKNIVHAFPHLIKDGYKMTPIWKRIDFGNRSISIDYVELKKFLRDNKIKLIDYLRQDRYNMIDLAIEYLTNEKNMDSRSKGKLEILVGYYRQSSIEHYCKGLGPTVCTPRLLEGTQRL